MADLLTLMSADHRSQVSGFRSSGRQGGPISSETHQTGDVVRPSMAHRRFFGQCGAYCGTQHGKSFRCSVDSLEEFRGVGLGRPAGKPAGQDRRSARRPSGVRNHKPASKTVTRFRRHCGEWGRFGSDPRHLMLGPFHDWRQGGRRENTRRQQLSPMGCGIPEAIKPGSFIAGAMPLGGRGHRLRPALGRI